MNITINGKLQAIADNFTIHDLLAERNLEGNPIVVEVNKAIVPRENYSSHRLAEDDTVEILRFVGGG